MDTKKTTSYQHLAKKLNKFIVKYYKNQILRGGIYALGIFLLFFISLTSIEYFAHFGTTGRTILFYLFVSSNIFVFTKYIAIPTLKLYKLGNILTYEESAIIIGNHFPNIKDKLLNVLQLQQQSIKGSGSINIELLEASINQKTLELKPVSFNTAINFKENIKHVKYIVIPFLIIILMLLHLQVL
jgi:hypothetical protein